MREGGRLREAAKEFSKKQLKMFQVEKGGDGQDILCRQVMRNGKAQLCAVVALEALPGVIQEHHPALRLPQRLRPELRLQEEQRPLWAPLRLCDWQWSQLHQPLSKWSCARCAAKASLPPTSASIFPVLFCCSLLLPASSGMPGFVKGCFGCW